MRLFSLSKLLILVHNSMLGHDIEGKANNMFQRVTQCQAGA